VRAHCSSAETIPLILNWAAPTTLFLPAMSGQPVAFYHQLQGGLMFKKTLSRSSVFFCAAVFLTFSTHHVLAAGTAAIGTSQQIQQPGSMTVSSSTLPVTGRLSIGVLNGEANEIVYDTSNGAEISHLEWQIDNVAMVGAGISFTPASWLKINTDIWVNISDGSGSMDDYDWTSSNLPWTDWSHHDDMTVDQIFFFDLNAEMPVLKRQAGTIFGIVGVKRDNFEMSASGGDYIYSNNGFRDSTGSFPDDLQVISYEQTYTVPYLGLGFQADYHPLSFTGRIIGSGLVDLETKDTHYLRNVVFEDDFETGNMLALDVGFTYSFSNRLQLMGGFHYQYYDEVKGSTTITNLSTGEVATYSGDSAGSDNSSSIFMATIIYNL
jgi:plasminogen activator